MTISEKPAATTDNTQSTVTPEPSNELTEHDMRAYISALKTKQATAESSRAFRKMLAQAAAQCRSS